MLESVKFPSCPSQTEPKIQEVSVHLLYKIVSFTQMIFFKTLHTECLVPSIMWCLLENQWLLAAFCNSCVWVLQLSWVPKLNFNIIKSLWGRNQMCRACWETNELTGPEGFLSRTVGSFASQKKLRTHLQKTIHRKRRTKVCNYLNRMLYSWWLR